MKTEGIKYNGSKNKLIPLILSVIKTLDVETILDGFAGTTRVSQALKKSGYTVICNDISIWSLIFGECYLLNRKPHSHYAEVIEHLNNLEGKSGWFSAHYGGLPNGTSSVQKDGKKRIWQIHNTKKLDAIREEIDRLALDKIEKSVLLTSLILAMDKVDSSLGHQVSYLKEWSPRSFQTMKMQIPAFVTDDLQHRVLQKDIFQAVKKVAVDLAYFDPPYGSSNELMPPSRVRYASYYHLWKTICVHDQPELVGAANRRADVSDTAANASIFENFRRSSSGKYLVIEAIEKLLKQTRAKYILLSYSNGGRATLNELNEIIRDLDFNSLVSEVDYKQNVMSNMRWTNKWSQPSNKCVEYVFLLSKKDVESKFQKPKPLITTKII